LYYQGITFIKKKSYSAREEVDKFFQLFQEKQAKISVSKGKFSEKQKDYRLCWILL